MLYSFQSLKFMKIKLTEDYFFGVLDAYIYVQHFFHLPQRVLKEILPSTLSKNNDLKFLRSIWKHGNE